MDDLTQAWMKHIESVLLENRDQRLTMALINGLLFAVGSTVSAILPQPQEAPSAPVPRLVEPIVAFDTFSDVMFSAVSLQTALKNGLQALHKAHWEETEAYRNHVEFKPDYDRLQAFEDMGRLQAFIMVNKRAVPGEMRAVGNFVTYFERSTHNGELIATEDAIYVEPEFRKQGRADAFIKFVHASLQNAGVKELRVETKTTNRVGDLLQRRYGYELVAHRLSKRLDKPLYAPLRDASEAA